MWLRMHFDIRWSDVAFGLRVMGARLDRESLDRRIRQCWPSPDQMFPCLSVRTAFDLLWKSLDFPEGSEVLMSSLTIPDMVRIVEHHKLVPVPVDLKVADMRPDPAAIRRAITPATRAIVVAHLFGSRLSLDPIIEIAKQHNLVVIEDCAQAFIGCHWDGNPKADVTMFSFGPIKTATAFGGGAFCVRDSQLLGRIRELHDAYPIQSRWSHLKRFLKYTTLKTLSCRPVSDVIIAVCRASGLDYDRWISTVVRAFPGPRWLDRLRYRPSAPLLSLFERRLRTFDPDWIAARTARAERLARLMPSGAVRPAGGVADHSYWVFPILADDPDAVVAELAKAGFDASRRSSLRAVEPPDDPSRTDPATARRILEKIVFLPVGAGMPRREIERMADVLGRMSDRLTTDPAKVQQPTVFSRAIGEAKSG